LERISESESKVTGRQETVSRDGHNSNEEGDQRADEIQSNSQPLSSKLTHDRGDGVVIYAVFKCGNKAAGFTICSD
jgi:hypothetical protein